MKETVNMSVTGGSSSDLYVIDDQAALIYKWVVYSILCQIINIFGIVTNGINIACFSSQGFKESVNISLLGLSVSDLGSLTTMVGTCFFVTPAVLDGDMPFEPIEVMYLTTAMPHFAFTRVSSCITAVITLERCLCITAPLKIKIMVTPHRTTVIIISLFIVFICSAAPVYIVNKLTWKFSSIRNQTVLGLIFMENRENVETISFVINNFSIPLAAFIIIVVCTIILSIKLHSNTKWRLQTTIHKQGDRISSRNQKAAKMVVMISTLFIICFIPVSIIMLAIAFMPALSVQGKYLNIGIIAGGFGYIMEGINSSVNIFIYYHMSSKYRDHFCKLFYKTK